MEFLNIYSGDLLLIYSDNLCLLTELFRLFTYIVIINTTEFKFPILLFIFYFCHLFIFPLFFFSCLFLDLLLFLQFFFFFTLLVCLLYPGSFNIFSVCLIFWNFTVMYLGKSFLFSLVIHALYLFFFPSNITSFFFLSFFPLRFLLHEY